MRVADWILHRLADEGIGHIFVLPGGGAMHLNDALACEQRIEDIPCHHEQACGIAAEAYGRTGYIGNPGFGVAMVTTGPGATNIITPVAGAWIDSVPMLIISGQVKRPDRLNDRPIRQGGVQEVDIVPMVKSITKYAVTVDDPKTVKMHLDKALYLMRAGRPGPVWIDVPLDVQAAPVNPDTLPGWIPPAGDVDQPPDLSQIADMLAAAKRPLIVGGHGVRLSGAAQGFCQLIERLQVPAVLTWNALDLLPYSHPLNTGRPGVVATRAANFAVQNCDLLISIGARLDNIVTAYNPKGFARAARKVVVDVDANELANKSNMGIDQALAMDAGSFIHALLNVASAPHAAEWRARCADWKARYTQNEGRIFPRSGPISHAHFVEALSEAAPENTLIATGSSGLAVEFFYAGFRNKQGQRTFLTSGLGSMGYGLPAAIGACLGNGRRPMLAVESDGSLQLNLQELATLSSQKLPICLFIMNNGGYASIRNTQRNYFEGRYLASGPASGLHMPSFEKLAEVYGLSYMRVDDCISLSDVLSTAQSLPRPCIVEVFLVADESLQPKCAAIPREDGSIVSMPLEDMTPLLPLDILRSEMIVNLLDESYSVRS
jgi:acetolactate synthase-1/2/3 large subunit